VVRIKGTEPPPIRSLGGGLLGKRKGGGMRKEGKMSDETIHNETITVANSSNAVSLSQATQESQNDPGTRDFARITDDRFTGYKSMMAVIPDTETYHPISSVRFLRRLQAAVSCVTTDLYSILSKQRNPVTKRALSSLQRIAPCIGSLASGLSKSLLDGSDTRFFF
jgi:hypothetical protein